MTKIIHPYQLLEAPQVNILNNNIVEDVNYSYDEVDYGYKEIGSVTQNVYEFPQPITSSSGEVGYIGLDTGYTFVGDETASYVETIIVNQNLSYLIYLFNFPYSGSYDANDFQISEHLEYGGYIGTVQNKPFLRFIESNGISSTTSQYSQTEVFSNAEDALQYVRTGDNKNAIFKTIDGFGVYVSRLKVWLGMVGETPQYGIVSITKDFTITLLNKTISSADVQIDTNSNLSLESNELMQQNTKVNDTTQISEYIADDIKTHYADGKATISMQVVDDGTQEYDVHDIVEPRIAKTELVTTIYDNPDVEQIDAPYNSFIFFNGKFRKLLRSSNANNCNIYSSIDGKTWKFDGEIENCNSFIGVANNKLLVIGYGNSVNISDDGITFRRFTYMGTGQYGSRVRVAYHNGKYYFTGTGYRNSSTILGEGIFYINEHNDNEYQTPTLLYSIDSVEVIAVFNNMLFFTRIEANPTNKIYYSTDFETFSYYTTSSIGYSQSVCVTNDALYFPMAGASVVYYTNDGIHWDTFNLDCMNIVYDEEINCLIARMNSSMINAKKSFDVGQTWVDYNSQNNFNGADDMAIGNGIILAIRYTIPNAIGLRSVLWEKKYEDVEYPLLTNADNTPKEFEITSSELVYDGLTYYNIEAVEST